MIYSNLKRFDNKGRRLSIFATSKDGNQTLDIYVQVCSKKDQFKKEYTRSRANFYFSEGEINFKAEFPDDHPQIFNIMVEEGKPKITFLNWCRTNFQKIKEERLVNNNAKNSCTKYFERNGKIFRKTIC